MLNFVYRCLRSESPIVNFTVRHGMSFGLMDSKIGRNVLNCSLRYNTSIECINNLEFRPYSIDKRASISKDNLDTVALLIELIQCRDGTLCLTDNNYCYSDTLTI